MGEPAGLPEIVLAAIADADIAFSVADARDPDVPLIYVNAAFERLTGYAAADAVGRNARFMQGPETDGTTVRAMGASLRAGRAARARVLNYRADGSALWVDLHVSPARDRTSTVTHFIAVQHDVTADVLSRMEAEHAVDRARVDFHHELRRLYAAGGSLRFSRCSCSYVARSPRPGRWGRSPSSV